MKKIICSFLLLFNSPFLFAQNAYKQSIADLVTFTFPQKPITQDTLGNNVAQFVDSIAIYSVISRAAQPENELPLQSSKLTEYYDSFINGFVRAAKGRLISKKPFEIDGFKGVDIEVISEANPNLPDLRYARIILLDNTCITANFMTWSEEKEASQTARTQFFNSLTITDDKTTLTQGVDHPRAHALAYTLGRLSVFVIIIGVITGMVFLIKKITTRKKKTQKTDFS